jgi:hypothetical protein
VVGARKSLIHKQCSFVRNVQKVDLSKTKKGKRYIIFEKVYLLKKLKKWPAKSVGSTEQ